MARDEKRRKFDEAVINMFYSPPSYTPQAINENLEDELYKEEEACSYIEDRSSSDSSNGDQSGPEKLTRAQRKRLRRKNVKMESYRRSQIIGPLLPPSVRQNAQQKDDPARGLVEACSGADKSRVKRRRKAKKLGRDTEKNSSLDSGYEE